MGRPNNDYFDNLVRLYGELGTLAKVAEHLGISRQTLDRHMLRAGITLARIQERVETIRAAQPV